MIIGQKQNPAFSAVKENKTGTYEVRKSDSLYPNAIVTPSRHDGLSQVHTSMKESHLEKGTPKDVAKRLDTAI